MHVASCPRACNIGQDVGAVAAHGGAASYPCSSLLPPPTLCRRRSPHLLIAHELTTASNISTTIANVRPPRTPYNKDLLIVSSRSKMGTTIAFFRQFVNTVCALASHVEFWRHCIASHYSRHANTLGRLSDTFFP